MFNKGMRVVVSDKVSQFHGEKGIVVYKFDFMSEVKLDNKLTIIIGDSKLKQLKKKK